MNYLFTRTLRLTREADLFSTQKVDKKTFLTWFCSFSGQMCGLAITLIKWNDWMEVNGGMTCKLKLPLLFSSHDDLRYSVSPGSCHPLWHRSHRRKSHIWHRRSHGLCDRPWRTLCTHLPHPPSYRCDSGTCRMKSIGNTIYSMAHHIMWETKEWHCISPCLNGYITREGYLIMLPPKYSQIN